MPTKVARGISGGLYHRCVQDDENPTRPPSMMSERIDGFELLETGTLAIYSSMYDRIFWDLDHAKRELEGPQIDFASLIHAAAHLRLVLERVATASFVASRELFIRAQQSVETAKDFGEMRKRVRALNSHYWPSAFGPVEHDGKSGLGVLAGVGLAEGDVGRSFGTVSRLLHAPNPFRQNATTPDRDLEVLDGLIVGLQELLHSHIVQIANSTEFLYLRRSPAGEILAQAVRTEAPLLR